MKQAWDFLKYYQKQATPLLKDYFQSKLTQTPNYPILKEALNRLRSMALKGKKLRGALVVLGYYLAGGTNQKAILDASLALELLQDGLLIHDDIIDQDDLRRGLPTIHQLFTKKYSTNSNLQLSHPRGSTAGGHPPGVSGSTNSSILGTVNQAKSILAAKHYGNSMAICIGDLSFHLAWEKLLTADFPFDRLIRTSQVFATTIQRVVQGQMLDINNLNHLSDEAKINLIHQLKTAEYTGSLPLVIGATLAGETTQTKLQALKDYGMTLGQVFQISDDLIDIFGETVTTGKPIGTDIINAKQTHLTAYVTSHGSSQQKKQLKTLLAQPKITNEDITKLKKLLKTSGADDYVINLGKKLLKKGKQLIPNITSKNNQQQLLLSLLQFAMERNK